MAVVLALGVSVYVVFEFQLRREALKRAHETLESRVHERTAELELSGLDGKKAPIEPQTVSIPDLIHDLARETQALSSRPEVSLSWRLAPNLSSLRTDPLKLGMVLKNLLSNALRFTERGDIIVEVRDNGASIEFVVRDTGIGIAPEAMTRIFEPFSQADSSIAHRYGGVGLGLHIVRRLLDVLGGAIRVESEPGKGSAFSVSLPKPTQPSI